MFTTYRIPPSVTRTAIKSHPTLNTEQGGKIIVDRWMLNLWREADNNDLQTLLGSLSIPAMDRWIVPAALACLVEAGLLERENQTLNMAPVYRTEGDLVSIIIVSHNSRGWLADCLPSIFRQTYSPMEVIVVDNASEDGTIKWLNTNFGDKIALHELEQPASLAFALNRGIDLASGKHYLLLNPDTILAEDAVARMVRTALEGNNCAAIAPKLKFSLAPAFINGIGNSVGAFGWGTDSVIGHLDLGQFDHWNELPSACFAAALIPALALEAIGPLDENFPLYYEDSEWCYRARLMGYHIVPSMQAIVYHAFSGVTSTGSSGEMTARKLQSVIYGRLQFISKILEARTCRRFMVNYALEDCLRCGLAVLQGRWAMARTYLQAWYKYFETRSATKERRGTIQSRRKITDQRLFQLQSKLPKPLIWNALPLLTRDIVENHYLPLMLSGKTRVIPELTDRTPIPQFGIWQRARRIQQNEGWKMLSIRMGKTILFRLSRA